MYRSLAHTISEMQKKNNSKKRMEVENTPRDKEDKEATEYVARKNSKNKLARNASVKNIIDEMELTGRKTEVDSGPIIDDKDKVNDSESMNKPKKKDSKKESVKQMNNDIKEEHDYPMTYVRVKDGKSQFKHTNITMAQKPTTRESVYSKVHGSSTHKELKKNGWYPDMYGSHKPIPKTHYTRETELVEAANVSIQYQTSSGKWITARKTSDNSPDINMAMRSIKKNYPKLRVRAIDKKGNVVDILKEGILSNEEIDNLDEIWSLVQNGKHRPEDVKEAKKAKKNSSVDEESIEEAKKKYMDAAEGGPKHEVNIMGAIAKAVGGRTIDFKHNDGSRTSIGPAMARKITATLDKVPNRMKADAVARAHKSADHLKDMLAGKEEKKQPKITLPTEYSTKKPPRAFS